MKKAESVKQFKILRHCAFFLFPLNFLLQLFMILCDYNYIAKFSIKFIKKHEFEYF